MMKRTNNTTMSPGVWNSLLTVAAVGLAGFGLTAVATSKKAAEQRVLINKELAAGTAMCQNAVLEFVRKLTDKDENGEFLVMPTAKDGAFPTMCEIQEAVEIATGRFQRIKHPVCVDLARQVLEIELILIALIRAGFGMSSWTNSCAILSPMDMWERLDLFLYELFHGGDMILVQQNIRDNSRVAELSRWSDELKLLKLSMWEEIRDIGRSSGSTAGKVCTPTALRRAGVTIPFLIEVSNIKSPPLLIANAGLPVEILIDSSRRALAKRTAEQLHKHFIEKRKDEGEFIQAYAEMTTELSAVSTAPLPEVESALNSVLRKFGV